MNPHTQSQPRPELEHSEFQFITSEFAQYLGAPDTPHSGMRWERIYWIRDRLFVDGWTPEQVRHALQEADAGGRIVAVTSGKGGVGKTTVALNLAVASARSGARTLLYDGDFGMGNVHVFAGVDPEVTLLDVLDGRIQLRDAVLAGPAGVQLICGASGISRIASIDQRRLDNLAWQLRQLASEFDVIVLDTGAGVGREVMSLLSLADEILVVATPNLASTLDAYGVIKCVHESGIAAQVGVMVNLAKNEEVAGAVRERLIRCAGQFLQMPVRDCGWLPRAPRVESANHSRHAIVDISPNSEVTRRFRALAATLIEGNKSKPDDSEPQTAAAATAAPAAA
jgi:flagellar biosynthesis protein FlhG